MGIEIQICNIIRSFFKCQDIQQTVLSTHNRFIIPVGKHTPLKSWGAELEQDVRGRRQLVVTDLTALRFTIIFVASPSSERVCSVWSPVVRTSWVYPGTIPENSSLCTFFLVTQCLLLGFQQQKNYQV